MRNTMRGFTLIEIMLVMIIIGCAAGIVILSIPGGPNPKLGGGLAEESQQLAASIKVMSEQATQQGRTIGLHITPHGYQFMVMQEKAASNDVTTQPTSSALDTLPDWEHQIWQPYQNDKLRTAGEFDQKISLSLNLEGLQLQDEDNKLGRSEPQWFDTENQLDETTPQILLLPSGEITPFALTLEEKKSDGTLFRQIKSDENGQITVLNNPDESHFGDQS